MSSRPEQGFPGSKPALEEGTVQLAHGGGGRLSGELVERLFLSCFDDPVLQRLEDQAVVEPPPGRLALTTDSFVVSPLFFPGGCIGELAVYGTVNDIAMCGATPLYLSCGFIIEEGLPLSILERVARAMAAAARRAGVRLVTGDTKVVPRGACDQLFINTSGVGVVPAGLDLSAAALEVGDAIILSGTIGDHGMAIMTSREGLSFASEVESDTAPLNGLVARMLAVSDRIHAMRDPTRGGLATTLNEFARASRLGLVVDQQAVPVADSTRSACELLGIDPLSVANEGKLVAAVAGEAAATVLAAMREHPLGRRAAIIGRVVAAHPGLVTLRTPLGVERILDMPLAEQLPRIC